MLSRVHDATGTLDGKPIPRVDHRRVVAPRTHVLSTCGMMEGMLQLYRGNIRDNRVLTARNQ